MNKGKKRTRGFDEAFGMRHGDYSEVELLPEQKEWIASQVYNEKSTVQEIVSNYNLNGNNVKRWVAKKR